MGVILHLARIDVIGSAVWLGGPEKAVQRQFSLLVYLRGEDFSIRLSFFRSSDHTLRFFLNFF